MLNYFQKDHESLIKDFIDLNEKIEKIKSSKSKSISDNEFIIYLLNEVASNRKKVIIKIQIFNNKLI